MVDKRALVAMPGKFGDVIYSLPAVKQLKKKLGIPIDYLTSSYCQPIISLLESQPCISKVIVDSGYWPVGGPRPATKNPSFIPQGYDHVFDLNFDWAFIGPLSQQKSIVDMHFKTLRYKYRLDLDEEFSFPYLDGFSNVDRKDYVVFNAWSDSFLRNNRINQNAFVNILMILKFVLKNLNMKIVAVTGPDQTKYHETFGYEVITSVDFLETARLIAASKLFIGLQSSPYVVADALQHPRLIYGLFNHVLPIGDHARVFRLSNTKEEALMLAQELLT